MAKGERDGKGLLMGLYSFGEGRKINIKFDKV